MNPIDKISEFKKFGSVLGLERMTVLLDKLGNPQDDLKVVHVAGTNGKGSVCRFIYEVLQAGGYRTGLYTSPFIEVFNERIELNHEYISDEDLQVYTDRVVEKTEEMIAEGFDSPTEFEIITVIAFLYFKEKNAEYVVLEVGLGGLGDSTNVVKEPLASVITSISLDHTDRLGETISEIASEKAGIIKKGCPVITSVRNEEALQVIRKTAEDKGAELYYSGDGTYDVLEDSLDGYVFKAGVLGESFRLKVHMLGQHQLENAMAALTALIVIRRSKTLELDNDAIVKGFENARHMGRFEVMKKNPYVIIDGAHNPDGAAALKNAVHKYFREVKPLMVVGILADKNVDEVLNSFRAIADDFIVTQPDNPRKMEAAVLAKKIEEKGGRCLIAEEGCRAAELALSKLNDYDFVLFAGSLYLIGEIRGILRKCFE